MIDRGSLVDPARSDGEPASLLAMTGLVKPSPGRSRSIRSISTFAAARSTRFWDRSGAGKSTLIKILAGVYEADAGEILFAGKPAHPGTDALPIAFIHQDLGLVEWMTVAENGLAIQTGYPRSWTGLISWPTVKQRRRGRACDHGQRSRSRRQTISSLPAAERSLVAIGRALAVKSDIVVLDEPTAALPEADVERLLKTLRRLRANNIGVVYVTHRLDGMLRIADPE